MDLQLQRRTITELRLLENPEHRLSRRRLAKLLRDLIDDHRRIELVGLDECNWALKQQIYALLDNEPMIRSSDS